jgi:HEAT repeat protein
MTNNFYCIFKSINKKTIFIITAACFTAASILCAGAHIIPETAAAAEFVKEAQPQFTGLKEKWKNASAEIELKFKNLRAEDIINAEKQLYYLFIPRDEFIFLFKLLLKSDHSDAIELSERLLNDEKIGGDDKLAILNEIAGYMALDKSKNKDRLNEILRNFINSGAAKKSNHFIIAAFEAIAARKNDEAAAKLFISLYGLQENKAVRARLIHEAARFSRGVEILAAEYKKAVDKNDIAFAIEVIRAIGEIKSEEAYDRLADILKNEAEKKGAGGVAGGGDKGFDSPLYNHIRDCAGACGNKKFVPVIENLLASKNTVEINKGFEYLPAQPDNSITIACKVYSQLSETRHKKFYLRKLIDFLKSRHLSLRKPSAEEVKLAYSIVKEAMADSEPALKKSAFEIMAANLKNEEFKILVKNDAKTGAGAANFLTLLAFYINGERDGLIDYIKTADFTAITIEYRELTGACHSHFQFNEADYRSPEELSAFFNFLKLQTPYFQQRVIGNMAGAADKEVIKKLAAFSSTCPPDFIKSLKNAITANAERLGIINDEYLLNYSGYLSSPQYKSTTDNKKYFETAGGNLKKYLVTLMNAGNYETEHAFSKIAGLIIKTPEAFMETLKDEYYPLEAKLLLLKAASEKLSEIKNEASAARGGLCELITAPGSDARLAASAINLLSKIDRAAALDALKKALAAASGDPYREPVLLSASSFIKTPECAEFIIDKFISPAVDNIHAPAAAGKNDETPYNDEAFDGELIFKTAMGVLYELNDCSKAAAAKLINQKPYAAPILIQYSAAGEAGGAAVKYYLDSFDASRYANLELAYLKRFADKTNLEALIEFYDKKYDDIDARIAAAAIFYKNGVRGPAGEAMAAAVKSGAGEAMISKLLDAGFESDFINNYYGAAVKFIANPPAGRDKISHNFKSAQSDFYRRYPGYGKEFLPPAPPEFVDAKAFDGPIQSAAYDNQKSLEVYLKYLDGARPLYDSEPAFLLKALQGANLTERNLIAISGAASRHALISLRRAAHKRIAELIDEKLAGKKNANEKTAPAEYKAILDALINSCNIDDFKSCLARAENLAAKNMITAEIYTDASYYLCSPFDLKIAGFQNLSLQRKSEVINHALSRASFDIILTFGDNAAELTLDFNALLSSKNADAAFIDSLIQQNENKDYDYNYNYRRELYLLRLLKTNDNRAKLKFIEDSIEKAGKSDRYDLLDSFGQYFTIYDGDNLINLFAAAYADKLDKIKNSDALTRLTANALDGDTLKKIIVDYDNAKNRSGLSQHIFDAYAARGGAGRFKQISLFCESKNYEVKNGALRSLHGSGEEGFETLKALFEKYCGDKDRYRANDYIAAMAETGAGQAFKFLTGAALDDKLKDFHPRIIDEIGEIKTAESLNWLLSQLFIHAQGGGIYNALNNMCRLMIFEFLEAYKNSEGKRKTAAASILFQHSVKKPFIEIMAAGPQLIAQLDENFRPSSYHLERGDSDGAVPDELMKKALAAISAVIEANLKPDYKPERETAAFHSYLCFFLGRTRDMRDIKLLIALLDTDACASSAARALNLSRLNIGAELIAAARSNTDSARFQRNIISVLVNKNISGASDIYLKALGSKDSQLLSAALEAVSKFKIKEAVPAVITMLDSKEGGNDYRLINCLVSLSTEAFTPLIDAVSSSGNTEGVYRALKSIVSGAAYGSNAAARDDLAGILEVKFEAYSANNRKTALLISFLLAGLDKLDKLSLLLEKDGDILLLAGDKLFDYIEVNKLIKLGGGASTPLINLLIKADGEKHGFKYSIVEALEKIGDAGTAPALSNYLKTCRDDYLKRRILEALSKISKDSVITYLNILATEKNYYLRRSAAECLAKITETDPNCRSEILKLLSGPLEDEIKALLIKALAAVKYEQAAPVMLAVLKKSRNPLLLEAAGDALFKLDMLENIRLNLAGIIKEPEHELNSAYAVRVLGYYRDSQSVDIIKPALLKAVEKGSRQAKIEFIKAAAAVNSPGFLEPLSIATSDPCEDIRTAAVEAIKIIAGRTYDKYCAPMPPLNLKADCGDGSILLNWDAPEGKAVESYEIYRDNKKIAEIPASGRQYSDDKLKNGKNYSYYIKAADAHSNIGAPSASIGAVPSAPPGPVKNLKVKSGPSYLTLSWQYEAPNDNAVENDHFIIERDSKPAAKISANTITYTDYGLSAGKIYIYKVYAVNRTGGSGEKAGASGTPHFTVKGGE